jgi:DNA invertase Pin-like site-specific DNA recombinase
VSTENGLDQEFNSLDAQHEAADAFIRSQAHAGWTLVRTRYDDGGYSGGSTERPALQRLLADIRARQIDVIVVYKVDRLTRSLADFAKLVELFDAHEVSFVSVTQQFNTTTSMGRLTLNVLLSFAQFEREVTSERIRDKIAASKRRGIWVGGVVPLGYESRNKKLVVNEEEAARVRTIFQAYLELGSLGHLLPELRRRGLVTKARALRDGSTIGGIPFTRGPLAHLLRNRFYIGEVVYRGEICPGEHPPIIDRDLFEAVQRKLADQRNDHHATRGKSEALLIGRIFDDRGNRMTPSHARKAGVRYRYYVSAALTQGQPELAGSVSRVPAVEIEQLVCDAVLKHLAEPSAGPAGDLVREHVARVEVGNGQVAITLHIAVRPEDAEPENGTTPTVLSVPWRKISNRRHREIIIPSVAEHSTVRPIRADTRAKLVAAIARGRSWLAQIQAGTVASVDEIAAREQCSKRHVNMTISLAFLAPDLVQAAIKGLLPHGIGVARLLDPPVEWARQRKMLGLLV